MEEEPLSILYVDDDPDVRTIVELSLGLDPQVTVHLAENGTQALGMIDKGLEPDVLLVDVLTPVINGMELAQTLYRRGRRRPSTIFLTANPRQADLRARSQTGVLGVIAKPFDPLHLAADIRRTLQTSGSH